jgi:tripartite-type tricarboxylate transporter receptor subunit TctC
MISVFSWRRIAAAALACVPLLVLGQPYPSKPIRIIVPTAPGGTADAVARMLGPIISDWTGQPVIVDNRPGASTIIGMSACAKAAPDGYTLCIAPGDSLAYNPYLYSNLPYDPEKDFTPVTQLAWTSNLLVANGSAPFNTYREMLAYAKANPGALNWGTWGAGTLPDVYLKWVEHQAAVKITAIPYKSAPLISPAMFAGEIHLTYMGFGTALPQIKAGKLKALVTVGNRRSVYMPNLPTLAEEGGDPDLLSYFGVLAPARTPRSIVERLNADFAKAIHEPRLQEPLRKYTLEAVGSSPSQFAELLRIHRANATRVFKLMGVRPSDAPS